MNTKTLLTLSIVVTFVISLGTFLASAVTAEDKVTLQYIGHSCVMLIAPDGTRIVADPYQNYQAPREIAVFPDNLEANAVTISHFHPDHTNSRAIQGKPQIFNTPGTYQVGMVKITGYKSDHGNPNGADQNTVFVFEIGALKIVHMGAAGVVTQPEIQSAIQNADVILIDAHGDAVHPIAQEMEQMKQLNARTVIPTHYGFSPNARYYGTATLDEVLSKVPADMSVVKTGSELQVTPNMPKQVVVLTPLALKQQKQ
jgi:L-ascorbate metabolism protein UlaG (beta-lactamase superfamily)